MNKFTLPAVAKNVQSLSIDKVQAKRHLDALIGKDSSATSFLFAAFDERKNGRGAEHLYGTLDQHIGELGRLNADAYGIFVTVNETKPGDRRRAEDVTRLRAHFIDLDRGDVRGNLSRASKWTLPPHLVVETSKGRCHVYWRLGCEGVDKIGFQTRQEKLAKHFSGDPAVTDLPRVMRLAGSWHMKGAPYLCRCGITKAADSYSLQQFESALADVTLERAAGGGMPDRPIGDQSLRAPTADLACQVLRSIPCGELDRNEWVAVAHAFKASIGSDDFDAFLEFDEWCSGYAANTTEGNARLWDGIRTSRTGWPELVHRAGPSGKEAAARHWFDDVCAENDTLPAPAGGAAAVDTWDDPDDLWSGPVGGSRPLPDPDDKALPEIIRRFADDRARRLGVSRGSVAAAAVTALGALVPAGNVLQVRQRDPEWTVKAILWCCLIGEPGSNKSATLSAAVAPVHAVEREWRAAFAREASRREAAAKLEPVEESGEAIDGDEAPTPLVLHRKIINDATTEAVAAIADENPHGLLLHVDELAGFTGSMDAYRPAGAARGSKDRGFWLKAKDGESTRIDRKGSGHIFVETCAVSILGSIQPDRAREVMAGLAGDGMLQRFWTIEIRRTGRGEDIEADPAVNSAMAAAASRLGNVAPNNVRYRLAPDADEVLQSVESFKERELRNPEVIPSTAQWLDKLPNEFARLALAFHFFEWAATGSNVHPMQDAPAELVSRETAERALRFLTRFVFPHVARFHARLFGHSDSDVTYLAGLILSHQLARITQRDVNRAGSQLKGPEKDSRRLKALRALEAAGWLMPIGSRGRAEAWGVNPKVHDGRFRKIAEQERRRRADARASIEAASPERRKTKSGRKSK